ncbi:hypothetical protein B4Q13_14950 [Lacticaseibacillus rhamnosus]
MALPVEIPDLSIPELGAAITEEIPELDQIETTTRTLSLDWGEETNEELPFAQPEHEDEK